ncbi:MAG TPA: MFS transporter [Dongiaceae bacterium]
MVALLAWRLLRNGAGHARAHAATDSLHEGFVTRVLYLLRRPAFHGLFWSFLLCGYTTTGVIETHLIPYAEFCGIPPAPSSLAFGILMGVNTLGMVAAGYLTDRMNRTLLLASIYFFRSLTFLMLPLVIGDPSVLWIFAVLFGIFDYATVPPTASLAAGHLGKARVGTAMGLISAGHSIGAALGAFMGGYLFDATGGYGWLWSSSFGLALAAAMIAAIVPSRVRAAVPA